MNVAQIMQKMIVFSDGNLHDIAHFMKVWGFARTIGQLEDIDEEDQLILEVAAIVHDIACPLCREKYGNTNGAYQEKEGYPLAKSFLAGTELSDDQIERIAYLVGHHHTTTDVEGIDYQILLEADFLVNADESHYSKDVIRNYRDTVFKTAAGRCLLNDIYKIED